MSDGTDTEGSSGRELTVDEAKLADPSVVLKYVRAVAHLQLLFSLTDEQMNEAMRLCEQNVQDLEALKRFIGDPSSPVLFLQRKQGARGGEEGEEVSATESDTDCGTAVVRLSAVVQYDTRSKSIILVKRGELLEAEKPIAAQVTLVQMLEGNAYESLHTIVASAVTPYLKSYIQATGRADRTHRDGDKLLPAVEKQLAEVEMGLLHLQQNIDIPDVVLAAHRLITKACLKAKDAGRHPDVGDIELQGNADPVEDSGFLNNLQNNVNVWIKEIQKVTKLDRDAASGTAMQEISFWINLERALVTVGRKVESPEVKLTMEVLKKGKRFQATTRFESDTGLKACSDTVSNYNSLMKDFPLNDLVSATDLEAVARALNAIFVHMRKIRHNSYPAERVIKLLEAISRDVRTQMLKVLEGRRVMFVSIDVFNKVMAECHDVFYTWDDEWDKLQQIVLRDKSKKRKIGHRNVFPHQKLRERLERVKKFRRQHDQLRVVILRVLQPQRKRRGDGATAGDGETNNEESNALEEVRKAYDNVKVIDVLDVGKEASDDAFNAALRRYDERIDRVEASITERLRDQLGSARNANEMFQIFSRYNALFVRPHIRGAIHEYQKDLMHRVKEDISRLQAHYTTNYTNSSAAMLSRGRDVPPVAGTVMFIKQIDRQLAELTQRVGDVLGREWEKHVDGQALKNDIDAFRRKLNTETIIKDWMNRVQAKEGMDFDKIMTMAQHRYVREDGTRAVEARVAIDFPQDIIQLAKEVRHLKSMGVRIPMFVVNKAHNANQLYPPAICLIEALRIYHTLNDRIAGKPTVRLLLADMVNSVHDVLVEGASLQWSGYRMEPFVKKCSAIIARYQEQVDEILSIQQSIEMHMTALDTCEYSSVAIHQQLEHIQKAVDQLALSSYSNLSVWVHRLGEDVEKRLGRRLLLAMQAWVRAVNGGDGIEEADRDMDAVDEVKEYGGNPQITPITMEIRLSSHAMYLSPPVEQGMAVLLKQLVVYQSIVTSQPRLSSTRYQLRLDDADPEENTFANLLADLPDHLATLDSAYSAMENACNHVKTYVGTWLIYQTLWDLPPEQLYERLGNNLSHWKATLIEIKKTRSAFDTAETSKTVGPFVVDYGKVQSKVSLKYDGWHKECLSKYSQQLSHEMTTFYADVSKARAELERQSVDASTTSEAVGFITYVQGLKRQQKHWQESKNNFIEGERLLQNQRYTLPQGWLYAQNIDGEWTSFEDILMRKDTAIQQQVSSLQDKIRLEDTTMEKKTTDVLDEWARNKPTDGDQRPGQALEHLKQYEARLNKMKEERDNLAKAKEALELDAGVPSPLTAKLDVALEEMADLQGVWQSLTTLDDSIDQLRDRPWLSVQPRKVRQALDGFVVQMKEMPSKYKNYDAYEAFKRKLHNHTKVNMLIVELKSEALKERHWAEIQKKLRVQWNLNDLTLGQVWDADLQRHEHAVREVMQIAQGEMALEEFIKQVREAWTDYELELINYQNKTRLIRGWDDLFNKLKEHINSLQAMKLSPFYKVFEEAATNWEDKLNRINTLFDVWIDVQRRWVYLEGIFSGSADIKVLLPQETARFGSLSNEYVSLMKRVQAAPRVMDVLNIQGGQRLLERLADMLTKIQKALGEYLERERASFPRFYFVGDEDLLEIIGNSKNIVRLQKHFKKMFAGVASILLRDNDTIVYGLTSREGEEMHFVTPVSIVDNPRINDWLRRVESEMRNTLAQMLAQSVKDFAPFKSGHNVDMADYNAWLDKYPTQLVVLTAQVAWSEDVDEVLAAEKSLSAIQESVNKSLEMLADSVLQEQPQIRRKKLEHLITEFVHKRDVLRDMTARNVNSNKTFLWLRQMRFYFNPAEPDVLRRLTINMANATFHYGFEYLGVQEKLVQTPLTDRCYLTMTQALEARLGGSPFGPAGTGKTETVKALGNQLGRFVLVFNCDETFDFQAMGRIFVGLCQVGAWGCFDEFNRLEERMLSACSQQIQAIQETLRNIKDTKSSEGLTVDLVGKQVAVNPDMAIFITMNPGYAGRSNLPDNLKQLFRSLAMTKPDRQLIAQVMLFSQGFRQAEKLAQKIVPFFTLCNEQLSSQSHYDFGLRALKYVLVSAGNIKREHIQRIKEEQTASGGATEESSIALQLPEQEILIQSVCETMVPKLVAEDIPLLFSLLSDVFPNVPYTRKQMMKLRAEVRKVCEERFLCYAEGEGGEVGYEWVEKVMQLYQITELNHGLMMVGPSGSGKSSAWRVLLTALQRMTGVEGVAHVIDPKAITKDALYGTLDPNTREWTDGLFTHVLRKIIDNVRNELDKRQWIIFDGDVDPEWVENLNSVLDDNKLLTLPNGERLALPPNVRIMFEVQDLKYATLATVSRCGMVWFSNEVVSADMLFTQYIDRLRNVSLDELEAATQVKRIFDHSSTVDAIEDEGVSMAVRVQREFASVIGKHMTAEGLVGKCLHFAKTKLTHVMDFTELRAVNALFAMINSNVRAVQAYNCSHAEFPMAHDQLEKYASRSLITNVIWAFSGDGKLRERTEMGTYIGSITSIALPPVADNVPIIDYEVTLEGEWQSWQTKVPQIEIESHRVGAPDLVIPTLDTVRHEHLLQTWLAEHKPMVLCGPPGSGKTMTLMCALRSIPEMEVVAVNFSSATTPELLLRTFDQHCEYRKTPNGTVLAPVQLGRWLVLFCDEINLPELDKYGTQRVISFLRQIVEHNGFYRTTDHTWVTLERIQIVGACNPPTDPGRKPMSHRFLRHVPVVYVDYPAELSYKQIYGTFNRAMLRLQPNLRQYADPLTNAMVEFYLASQQKFTQDMQPHYVYSPRELTRWVRGINEAIGPLDTLSMEGLVRLWAHEALRLFHDRLITDEERRWTEEQIDVIAQKHFTNVDTAVALKRPILYSNWLTKDYMPVEREELREFVKARLKVFYEEELDVPLVLFNEVLEHVLRIDRIYRQPQGHLLLIGVSGSGKTTLSRFVAWMNGLKVFQLKVHGKYTAADFDEDLRTVLRRSGCRGEKMCFIMDESNVLDTGFLERLNTLLANGEVPGLFEGDEHTTLMTQIKEGAARDGHMLDSPDEMYKWFNNQVIKNLHVVFTMNPSSDGLRDRAATSPALFNRCVLNWMGDWSDGALYEVGKVFTIPVDLTKDGYEAPGGFPYACEDVPRPPEYREAIVNAMVFVHQTMHTLNGRLARRGQRTMAVTPRHYLDFIQHFTKLYNEKRDELESQQLHLNTGLNKIRETETQVDELRVSLKVKNEELTKKNDLANAKLKQMLTDQETAVNEKKVSEQLQEQLEVAIAEGTKKKLAVQVELDEVEPAVAEAQFAINGVTTKELAEVRSLNNPPALVKQTMEAACVMLNEPHATWAEIRKVITRSDFKDNIKKFDASSVTPQMTKAMQPFIACEDWTFERVQKASKACGPIVMWARATLKYADMNNKVDPLRAEAKRLEDDAMEKKDKTLSVQKMITQLEESISTYKEEYAVLISEVNTIKTELSTVETKVRRSHDLLYNLASERERWETSRQSFRTQMDTIVGDTLISSAFLAYAGYFDQQLRSVLFARWQSHLGDAGISHLEQLARVEYLSNPDDRQKWQDHTLPTDDLCTENAIMLSRYNRYPLIIDPSGQATAFLMQEFAHKKIAKTSFLDDSFRKNLESALRFGTPLLVQDVESYDPILNPVLNREVQRKGGRVLIVLGDNEVDLSPAFQIFLVTRDPTVEFPPHICSRVTFVNFTVTRASLQDQCLSQVLKAERPDVDKKRSDLLKLQGEFALKLRHLEKALLDALNSSRGRILDDDSVITTLETLKREAAEVQKKVDDTAVVMEEVHVTSQVYTPLSNACSAIYFTMEQLSQVHFLYQYALQFFFEIFTASLTVKAGVTDTDERLKHIVQNLFKNTYDRVSRGMLHEDKIILAVQLARIQLHTMPDEPSLEAEFSHLLRGEVLTVQRGDKPSIAGFSKTQCDALTNLAKLPVFANAATTVGQLGGTMMDWLATENAEHTVPTLSSTPSPPTDIHKAMLDLLTVHALRPDRFLASAHIFVSSVLGAQFMSFAERVLDMARIVEEEVTSSRPVLLCSVPGYDASGRVEDLAAQLNKPVVSIAIGSAEGFSQADAAINSASKSGRWVLLKNVHLATQWLTQLEKKLHTLQTNPQFRLFLTMEINPKLPVNVLRSGRILVFEPPSGLKANLLRTFSTLSSSRMAKQPVERARLYFVLAWLHAILQERLRYTPLGWSKAYEFSEADLRMSCDTLDQCVDLVAQGRSNLPPNKVPWDALRTLLSQCIYGGRIDNQFDQVLLDCFIQRLFNAHSFDANCVLIESIDGRGTPLHMPEGTRREQFVEWVDSITALQTPNWLGLPNNAENVLLTDRGAHTVSNLLKMAGDDEEMYGAGVIATRTSTDEGSDVRPQWMKQLSDAATHWLKMLPAKIDKLKRTSANIKDPLYRYFEREVSLGSSLLSLVRDDLHDVQAICQGGKKQTNYHRQLTHALTKGIVPEKWLRYDVPDGQTVMAWVGDFAMRGAQLLTLAKAASTGDPLALKKVHVCLGGLSSPEAYITASRQYVAQKNQWSLEELSLQVFTAASTDKLNITDCSFVLTGMRLLGATCKPDRQLLLTNEISVDVPAMELRWVHTPKGTESSANTLELPVYLYTDRRRLLLTLDFETGGKTPKEHYFERGVALVANAL